MVGGCTERKTFWNLATQCTVPTLFISSRKARDKWLERNTAVCGGLKKILAEFVTRFDFLGLNKMQSL